MTAGRTDPSIRALSDAAARKSAHAASRGLEAIKELARTRQPINHSSVARHAGLSRGYVSRNPTLRAEIAKHATTRQHINPRATQSQDGEPSIIVALRNVIRETNARHDEEIAGRSATIRELRATIRKLEDENARLRGQLRGR
ncbi:DUF6262 family protein [Microbacterium sp. RU33B]|uniref:DUF6262 family protein n=1 Tax=Microbacterium sp. RU33B TaxID=1907390 RepID=UPI000959057A|nr:DUF6262 family protein [Microbacterium sp. RU33B]SIT72104.1 hypothetical protein SAMN05880545_0996 [Microbacterium sp. RU33B]